jgi:hypothetical protein
LEYEDEPSCEAAFAQIEATADRLETAAKRLGAEAKKLSTAATVGNLPALRKARVALAQAASETTASIVEASKIDEEPLSRAVGSRGFLQEIIDKAAEIGFTARLSGLAILAFPNRLTVDEKGLKIGRKAVTSVRPSAVAALLKRDGEKSKDAPRGFIDSLSAAYDAKCPDGSRPVALAEIYELLTLLPESKKAYTESDFVRDLSVIDAYGPHRSRDGRQISFPAATSARMAKGFLSVSPSGDEVTYVNLRFIKPT